MATLFIDADACPVTRDALALARKVHVPVVVAGNTTQNLERHVRPDDPRSPMEAHGGFWVETLAVGVGADAADFAIAERLKPGDIVGHARYWLGEHGAWTRRGGNRRARACLPQRDHRHAAISSA